MRIITNYQRCILSSFQKHRRLCGCADEVLGGDKQFEFIREVDKLNTPKEQQQKLADMAAYASIRNESVIRAWGYSNPIVRNYVAQADNIRLEYATKLNEAIGLDAKQAMDLAVIQYSMLIGMQQVCSALSAEQFKELQDMVINKFKEQ